jgi:ferredoxin
MYDKLIIYYFTGTGNALAVANWIAQIAANRNITVEIKKITPSLLIHKKDFSENTLIGFCYPTHGFNAPPIVIDFLLRFPKMKNRVFVLNTRAGMKISKLFIPGISGLAQLLPSTILRAKGFEIVGFQPMDLPSNWISIHPGLRKKVVDSIFERCERITKRFADKILTGGNVYKGLISLPIDLIISPISIAYYFYGRFFLAKSFIADYNCNGCGLCEKECPVNAINMKNMRPFWTYKCENCMHCMNSCPQRAIQTPHLFVVVLWWLVFSVLPLFVMKVLIRFNPDFSEYYNLFFNGFVLITGLPIVFFSYRIFHWLMKFKFFNRLFTFTSLTKYKFWRRYFAQKKYL